MIEISFDKRLRRGGGRDLPPSEICFPVREQSVLISKVDLYLDQGKEIEIATHLGWSEKRAGDCPEEVVGCGLCIDFYDTMWHLDTSRTKL